MGRRLLKWLGWLIGVLAILLVVGWFAFVPSAKEPGYEFVAAWGEKGEGPGQFDDPTGVAVADGELFVSDARNGRIQVFDLDGVFKRQIGEPGDGPGQLGRPMNLTVALGRLYVADYWNEASARATSPNSNPLASVLAWYATWPSIWKSRVWYVATRPANGSHEPEPA